MTLPSTPSTATVDTRQCDEEPIHLIGQVQDFGCLLALDGQWNISHASANTADYLGRAPEDLLGTPLRALSGSEQLHALRGALQKSLITGRGERLFHCRLEQIATPLNLSIHHNGDYVLLEIEPSAPYDSAADELIRTMLHEFSLIHSYDALVHNVANSFKLYSGFDRVVVYRFGDDASGEVIAEARTDTMPSYLGLHFPASDIPKQARALYQKNLFRIIPDVASATHALHLHTGVDATPLDLSMTQIRAVSPVHIQYLKNMGVVASLSLSIIVDGKLWGLIACHHGKPRTIDFKLRSQLEVFAELFSLELSRQLLAERSRHMATARDTYNQVIARINTQLPIVDALAEQFHLLSSLIPCDGVGCLIQQHYAQQGVTLSQPWAKKLASWMIQHTDEPVYPISCLEEFFAQAGHDYDTDEHQIAGVLVVKISKHPQDYLFFFRKSVKNQIHWAGNPKKVVSMKDAQLTPRASFAKWVVEHANASQSWSASELEQANSMRVGILETSIRSLHENAESRRKTAQKQELLISELNHRVRNILNLVSAIVAQTNDTHRNLEEFIAVLSARIMALSSAHDQLTQSDWTEVQLRDLLETEFRAYSNSMRAVSLDGPQVNIRAYAVTPIVLVAHELFTNAAKYGALSATSTRGQVTVSWQMDEQGLHLQWEELGGPPVSDIDREGFGMTIIRSVIPHELQGSAEIEFTSAGLQARFSIPRKYVTTVEHTPDSPSLKIEAEVANTEPPSTVLKLGLIVEDSLLIALDVQKKLKALGCKRVHIEGSGNAARQFIEKKRPDVAILDVHLGNETSLALAHKLKEAGIPFLFSSGYGLDISLPETLRDMPMLAKPVETEQLKHALAGLGLMESQQHVED